MLLYAVGTALQLHIAELTEPLRELYVMAYSLPSIAAYLYKSTTKRLQSSSGLICRRHSLRTSIRNGDRVRQYHAGALMSVPCDVYFTMDAKISRFLDCSLKLYDVPKEETGGDHGGRLADGPSHNGFGHHPKDRPAGGKGFEALTEKQI